MTIMDDPRLETTFGTPDGPLRFVDSLGMEVPTFINPRDDLRGKSGKGSLSTFKSVDYHIPFALRGDFKKEDWPSVWNDRVGKTARTTVDGYVLCTGFSKRTQSLCASKAVNRTLFCRNHGGALHPADKIMSGFSQVDIPADRVANLDRVQQFMKDIITVEDLADDEIRGGFVRDSNGVPVKSRKLGIVFEQKLTKELHRRMNEYLRSKTPKALEVLAELVESDLVEPADRIKAIAMIVDRTMGKNPDVLITSSTEKPYEAILEKVKGGSREEHRKNVASVRGESRELDSTKGIVDAEEVDLSSMDDELSRPPMGQLSVDLSGSVGIFGSDPTLWENAVQESNRNNGDQESTSDAVASVADRRATFKAKRDALKKAKSRRFAARAIGAGSLENMPFGLEYSLIRTGKYVGKLRVRLVAPSAMTEARLAKMGSVNALTDDALAILYPPDTSGGPDEGDA